MFSNVLRLLIMVCLMMTTTLHAAEAPQQFSLSSSAFLDQGVLPVLYTCDGKDISPQIGWSNSPANTKSFALIMSDPSAVKGIFYHWVIFNIPEKTEELAEGVGTSLKGTVVAKNNFDKESYNGPCPPKGSAHLYLFTVYALDTMLSLPKETSAEDVLAAMKEHIVGQAKISAVYSRWILQ